MSISNGHHHQGVSFYSTKKKSTKKEPKNINGEQMIGDEGKAW